MAGRVTHEVFGVVGYGLNEYKSFFFIGAYQSSGSSGSVPDGVSEDTSAHRFSGTYARAGEWERVWHVYNAIDRSYTDHVFRFHVYNSLSEMWANTRGVYSVDFRDVTLDTGASARYTLIPDDALATMVTWEQTLASVPSGVTLTRSSGYQGQTSAVSSFGGVWGQAGEYLVYSSYATQSYPDGVMYRVTVADPVRTQRVVYDTDGGSEVPEQSHTGRESSYQFRVSSTVPVKDGYEFDRWTGSDGVTYHGGEYVTLHGDSVLTLTAVWNALHTCRVVYTVGQDVFLTDTYTGTGVNNHVFTVTSEEPSRTGYGFAGWSESPDGSAVYGAGDNVSVGYSSTLRLYAVFTAVPTVLVYDARGGVGGPARVSVTSESPVVAFTISDVAPTLDGHDFDGWSFTTGDGEEVILHGGETLYLNNGETATVKAVWTRVHTLTVVFSADGGSGAPDAFQVRSRTGSFDVALPEVEPTREYRVFVGWRPDTDPSEVWSPGSAHTVPVDVQVLTLTALWETARVTIVLDPNGHGGVQRESYEVDAGTTLSRFLSDHVLTDPDHGFRGWSDSPSSTVLADYSAVVTTEMDGRVLYAVWDAPTTSTVQYFSDTTLSTGVGVQTDTHPQWSGTVAMTLRSPSDMGLTRDGFAFGGWMLDGALYPAGGTVHVPYDGTVSVGAYWNRLYSYLVTYSPNASDAQGAPAQTRTTEGTEVTQYTDVPVSEPTRDGYLFKGWSLTSLGDPAYAPGDRVGVTSDTVLYAVWRRAVDEVEIRMADGSTVMLGSIDFNDSYPPVTSVGHDLGPVHEVFEDLQVIPVDVAVRYLGLTEDDYTSELNPDLVFGNTYRDGVLGIAFDGVIAENDSVTLAVFDPVTLKGRYTMFYIGQETDTTYYTVFLDSGYEGGSDHVFEGLFASYRDPYEFRFPDYSPERPGYSIAYWVSDEDTVRHPCGDVVLLVGRYAVQRQTLTYRAVWVYDETMVYFQPQGGVSSPYIMRSNEGVVSEDGSSYVFQIPSQGNMSRFGYEFLGWSETASGTTVAYTHGDSVSVPIGTTLVLYGVWRPVSSPYTVDGELRLPYCAVRIHRDRDVYWDATFYQVDGGLAVVEWAENRPASASFRLVNNYTVPGMNILSDDFSGWSDGSKGPVECGMYVEFRDILSLDRAEVVSDGYISSVTPDGETVAFEVADGVSVLGRTGSYVRRNYRDTDTETSDMWYDAERVDEGHSLVRYDPSEAVSAVYWSTPVRESTADGSPADASPTRPGDLFTAEFPTVVDGTAHTNLRSLVFRMASEGRTAVSGWEHAGRVTVSYEVSSTGSTAVATGTASVTLNDDRTHPVRLDTGALDVAGTVRVRVRTESVQHQMWTYHHLRVAVTPASGESVETPAGGRSEGVGLAREVVWDTVEPVTDAEVGNGVVTVPRGIDPDLPYTDRRAVLVTIGGKMAVTDVMSQIMQAVGMSAVVNTPSCAGVFTYRVGGAFVQSYLQKLADVTDGTAPRLSYLVRGRGTDTVLHIGERTTVSRVDAVRDTYPTVGYAGDGVEHPVSVNSLRRTLRNRPNVVTLRSSGSEPVTVTVADLSSVDARGGMVVEALSSDGNATQVYDAVSTAFGQLDSVALDTWEGTLTLPGITTEFVHLRGDDPHSGSGRVIRVKDSRYGIDDCVRVVQCRWDYNACTTTLTVSNYDIGYSSSVADTVALAVTTADISAGIGETSLLNRQYLWQTAPVRLSDSFASVEMYAVSSAEGVEVPLEPPTVLRMPDGDTVLVSTTTATSDRRMRTPYAVDGLRLVARDSNGSVIQDVSVPVDRWREPDMLLGQTLTVCLQLHL